MIDHATVERIIDAAEITDVVSDFVSLRKRGVNMLGLCPFHNEKTPSFTVSPAKGIFKCFGCGKGGNSVNFIMEHENLTYPEALKWLAKKFNIEIVEKEETEEEKQQKDDRESMMIVSSYAQKYFSDFLWEMREGKTIGLGYFKERDFRDDILKKFDVGYAPDGKTPFTDTALKEGYKIDFLEKTGLTIKRDDWLRDRFAGRVIFPIHNLAGRVIAFGGRILKDDKKSAKYLNSPESDIYHKSRALYGLFQAKREITKSDRCYLVEGYTDVLSMHQAGIENVVASSGTALTPDQIRLVKRFTQNLTIIYDGDEAGIKASLRGIDLVLEEGMNVKVLLLPQGEDPDSFAKKMGSSAFLQFINENETDFIQFKTRLLLEKTANDPIAKAKLISDVIRSVSVIPDTITRSVYIKECSSLLGVTEDVLYAEVRKQKSKQAEDLRKSLSRKQQRLANTPKTPEPKPLERNKTKLLTEEIEFLRYFLKYCRHYITVKNPEDPKEEIQVSVGEFMIFELEKDDVVPDHPVFQKFFDEVDKLLDDEGTDIIKYFLHHPDHAVSQLATHLLSEKYIESKRWSKAGAFMEREEDILDMLIRKIVAEFKFSKVKLMQDDIEKKIQKVSAENDYDALFDLLNTMTNLKKVEKQLSQKLGDRTIH